jgi:hypothetical protein
LISRIYVTAQSAEQKVKKTCFSARKKAQRNTLGGWAVAVWLASGAVRCADA